MVAATMEEAIKILLEFGADPSMRNRLGQKAADVARGELLGPDDGDSWHSLECKKCIGILEKAEGMQENGQTRHVC